MKKLTRIGAGLNAFKFSFAEDLLDEIRDSYSRELHPILNNPLNHHLLEGGRELFRPVGAAGSEYFLASFLRYPLLWLSCNTDNTYQIYKRFFDSLDIEDEVKELVDHDERLVMYCGSLVIGDQSLEHSFHVDYLPGANSYSFLTPLFELDPAHGDLLYKAGGDRIETYCYEVGKGIILGDNFYHCTEPYPGTGRLRVLITITFGTDKMEYWEVIRQTVGKQSAYMKLPCGHRYGACECAAQAVPPVVALNQAEAPPENEI
jgi:hypothetical protein